MLVYYGRRYYSPPLGSWATRDPIAEEGGQNLYAFVSNRPVNGFDALGNRLQLPEPNDRGVILVWLKKFVNADVKVSVEG